MREVVEQCDVTTLTIISDEEINSVCERFENELRAGRSPQLEDYCVENPVVREQLLAELLTLELEYLRKRNSAYRPDRAEYEQRFPANPAAVVQAISTFLGLYQIPPERWIGPYELLEELGRGGQGVVYRARHEGLEGAEHMVAVKLILPTRLGSYRDVDRFVEEVRKMVKLNHRGVLSVFDSGEDRGQPYMAMKLVGASLEHTLKTRGSLNPDEAARLVTDIARAVDYLHQHEIVHCDLKPSNILLDGDQPLITDFGLSRVLQAEPVTDPIAEYRLEGTIPYMSPEQVRGAPGKASDIYSLGAILFELLTGKPPFGSGRRALERIQRDEAPGPRQCNPKLPASLDRIVRKCLRKEPSSRYETAAQLAAELERFRRGDPLVHTPADTAAQRMYLWSCRHRELTSRLIALGSVLAVTQFNYFVILAGKNPSLRLHIYVTAIELVWIFTSIIFEFLSRIEDRTEPLRPAWIVIDVALLTALLGMLQDAARSATVLGYPLLIAISGLWCRVRLVWLTTALCLAGYATLVVADPKPGGPWTSGTTNHDPNVVAVLLIATGYVIALQVEKARAALNAVRNHRR
jgi:eukaryotic-like serine/threonine-protein kinase